MNVSTWHWQDGCLDLLDKGWKKRFKEHWAGSRKGASLGLGQEYTDVLVGVSGDNYISKNK
jgi:hypothetical protein